MKKINISQLTRLDCYATDYCSNIVHLKEMMDKQKNGAYIPYTSQEESILGCFNVCVYNCFCFKPIDDHTIIWISLDDCANIEQFEEEFMEEFDNYKLR